MNETYVNAMMILEVIIATLMVVIIILQPGDEGMGGFFGGASGGGESFRTKRGLEKFLYRSTIVLAIMFATVSFLIVKYTN